MSIYMKVCTMCTIYIDIFNECVCESIHTFILYGSEYCGLKHQKLNLTQKSDVLKSSSPHIKKLTERKEKHKRHVIGKKSDYHKPPSFVEEI